MKWPTGSCKQWMVDCEFGEWVERTFFCFYLQMYFKWGFPFSIVSDVADVPGAKMQLPWGKRQWHRVGLFQLSLLIERKIWLSLFLFINLSISLAPECDEWWVNNGVNDWIAMENIWARMIKRNHHVTRYNPTSAQIAHNFCADSLRTEVQMDTTVSAWRVGQNNGIKDKWWMSTNGEQ